MDKDIIIINKQREHFKSFMQQHKLKPFPWAKKAGVSESTIRNYLKGLNQSLTSLVLEKLASCINFSISDLICKNNNNQNIDSSIENINSLDRNLLIESYLKTEELIAQSESKLSPLKKAHILLAWYDVAKILKDESKEFEDLKVKEFSEEIMSYKKTINH